jgi:uncharacterized protein (DUF1015 family)
LGVERWVSTLKPAPLQALALFFSRARSSQPFFPALMLRIRAFKGLSPAPQLAAEVACVPYDVVNREESAALADGKPNSLLHVDRAEIDLPADTDPYSALVYETARKNFNTLQQTGALVREAAPAVYLYRQRMGNHVQTGLATVCHVDDYVHERANNPNARDIIKKHERTRPDKEDDRTRLIGTLRANTGPVFLTYRGRPEIDAIVSAVQKGPPAFDFVAPDGVAHTVWRISSPEIIERLVKEFAQLPCCYVADGHHRTASAARVGLELRANDPAATGNKDYDWFLAVLFPANQLQILPYNRVAKDLNGRTPEAFIQAVGKALDLRPNGSPRPAQPGQIRMYLGGAWYDLAWKPAANADPISRLDVSALQDRVLAPILGIDDPRSSKRIDFIGGIRGTDELVRLVDSGKAAVAFSMYPTTVEQLMAIADAGQIMPPKSTWFEPKLRSGLFIHTF